MPRPDSIFVLKVVLVGVEPAIWRRLLVPSSITLPKLHIALQIALGWNNSHLHAFITHDGRYGWVDPDFEDDTIDEKRKKLQQFLKDPLDRIQYEYDFGDGWLHQITLEDSYDYEPGRPLPVCIDGEMACPPDDVGGPHGYAMFLEAMIDSENPEHDSFVEWVGGKFEPEIFDIHSTNVLLGQHLARGV